MDLANNSKMISKSFLWMFLGLMATGLISWQAYESDFMINYLSTSMPILVIVQLGLVILFSFCFRKLPANIVSLIFMLYAIINGLTFSSIFYVYELGSVITIFFGSALLFLILGLIGYKSKSDFTNFGKIMSVGLLVGFIMMLINLVLANSMLDIILTWAMLAIFCGLTMYDLNKLKNAAQLVEDDDKMHIYFAMELYLDFINIFIRLLQILGKEK